MANPRCDSSDIESAGSPEYISFEVYSSPSNQPTPIAEIIDRHADLDKIRRLANNPSSVEGLSENLRKVFFSRVFNIVACQQTTKETRAQLITSLEKLESLVMLSIAIKATLYFYDSKAAIDKIIKKTYKRLSEESSFEELIKKTAEAHSYLDTQVKTILYKDEMESTQLQSHSPYYRYQATQRYVDCIEKIKNEESLTALCMQLKMHVNYLKTNCNSKFHTFILHEAKKVDKPTPRSLMFNSQVFFRLNTNDYWETLRFEIDKKAFAICKHDQPSYINLIQTLENILNERIADTMVAEKLSEKQFSK